MEDSVYSGLFRGAAWTGLMRWVLRLIGLVNIVILARLLTPADLGLVAMATLATTFADTFTDMGAQELLIRQQRAGRAEIDSAWTMQIIQGVLVCVLLLLAAPLAAAWFDNPVVADLVYVLALSPLVMGFRNIGITLARKELDFALEFRFLVLRRIGAFVFTLGLVLWLRNYWALVYGSVFGALLGFVLSYLMHPYRPRPRASGLRPYLRFAAAIIPLRIARFGNEKSGIALAGTLAAPGPFGLFNIGYDIASLFSRELIFPFTRGLFPGLSKINHEPATLARAFADMLGVAALCLLPVGVGLALMAEDFVTVLLGQTWLPAVPYMQWFGVASAITGLNHVMSVDILVVAGHERRAARLAWFRLCLFLPVMWLASETGGLMAIAAAHGCFALLFVPVTVFVLTRSLSLAWTRVAGALWRPCVAVVAMAVAVSLLLSFVPVAGLPRLLLGMAVGALVYAATLYLCWAAAGRPHGAEPLLYDYGKRALLRLRRA